MCTSCGKYGLPDGVYVKQDQNALALHYFSRPPFIASFRAGEQNFVCCTQHITFGGGSGYSNDDDDIEEDEESKVRLTERQKVLKRDKESRAKEARRKEVRYCTMCGITALQLSCSNGRSC